MNLPSALPLLIVEDIFRIIDRIRVDQKMAILLVEQNVRAALGIADEGHVMENGRIVMGGPCRQAEGQ
jgi:branched-chain amino acid transport system ATP-binding protein